MQWQQTSFLPENPTVVDIVAVGEETLEYAKSILLRGQKSATNNFEMPFVQSPILMQLSCSAERLIKALSALQSLMGKKEYENGRILLRNVNPFSGGWWKCLRLSEEAQIALMLCHLVESAYV